MLRQTLVPLAIALPFIGHGQGASVPTPKAHWPAAVQVPAFQFEADYSVDLKGNSTGFAPSIVSKHPQAVGFKHPLKSDIQGVLHSSPSLFWSRETKPHVPWDAISVVSLAGNAVDGHDADFQVDAHSKMKTEPTGILDPPGSTAFFVGEAIGWSKICLTVGPGARTWARFLETFTPEPETTSKTEAIFRGKAPHGWTVEVRTNLAGTELHALEIRNQSEMKLVRQITFDKWETVKGLSLPSHGEVSYTYWMDSAAEKPTEESHTSFDIFNYRPVATSTKPPWVEGMLFRTFPTPKGPPSDKPEPPAPSYRLVGGKLKSSGDPGNVFKETSDGGAWKPYVMGVVMLSLASGAFAIARRSRKN